MTHWLATPIVIGRVHPDMNPDTIEGDHKTVAGRENYIRSHGQAGVTYAVALRWPTNEGWVAADPVTVPIDTVSRDGDSHGRTVIPGVKTNPDIPTTKRGRA